MVREIVVSYLKRLGAKVSGVSRLQEEVDSLYYFVDNYFDIGAVPAASGALRRLQLCGLEMLRIFDRLCSMHELVYWLDFGTLLGAVRHAGYIPWDDDLDVSMTRTEWNRAARILPPLLEEMGFYVRVYGEAWFGFGYQRDVTGLWMDVFCYEMCKMTDYDTDLPRLHSEISRQLCFARKHKTFNVQPRVSRERMRRRRLNSLYSERLDGPGEPYYFESPENESSLSYNVYAASDLFPLSKLLFEGEEFPVPRDSDKFLRCCYGEYRRFPRSGILHHSINGVSLVDMAGDNDVNMDGIRDRLVAIRGALG